MGQILSTFHEKWDENVPRSFVCDQHAYSYFWHSKSPRLRCIFQNGLVASVTSSKLVNSRKPKICRATAGPQICLQYSTATAQFFNGRDFSWIGMIIMWSFTPISQRHERRGKADSWASVKPCTTDAKHPKNNSNTHGTFVIFALNGNFFSE